MARGNGGREEVHIGRGPRIRIGQLAISMEWLVAVVAIVVVGAVALALVFTLPRGGQTPTPTALPTLIPTPVASPVPSAVLLPTSLSPSPAVADLQVTAVAPGPPSRPAFREGPLVRLRPLESVVTCKQDGLVEAFFRNPSSNDVAMVGDISVSVPSDIFMYSTEGGLTGTAGTVSSTFIVQPGQAVGPFNFKFKSRKTGRYFVVFGGRYWPEGRKDLFQPLTLTAPLEVKEPSCDL